MVESIFLEIFSVIELAVSLKCVLLFIHDDDFRPFICWFNDNMVVVLKLFSCLVFVLCEIIRSIQSGLVMREGG